MEMTDKAFETLRRGRGEDGELVVKVMVEVTEPPTSSGLSSYAPPVEML